MKTIDPKKLENVTGGFVDPRPISTNEPPVDPRNPLPKEFQKARF